MNSPSDHSFIPLIGKRSWTIGRCPKSDIVVQDRCVSRNHGQLELMETWEFNFVDLGSGNGSLLNKQPVTLPVCLKNGDRLTVGHTELEFYCPDIAVAKRLAPTTSKQVLMLQSKRQGQFWRDVLMVRGITLTCPTPEVDLMQYLKQSQFKGRWPDLLLLDMTTLQPDPYSFCRWCRSTYPLLKIILTSGSRTAVSASERRWAMQQGAVDLLSAFPEQRPFPNLIEQPAKVTSVLKTLDWQPIEVNDSDRTDNGEDTILR